MTPGHKNTKKHEAILCEALCLSDFVASTLIYNGQIVILNF